MDSLASWLGSISWPIVSRLLTSLGLGTVTFVGANTAIDGAITASQNAFSGMASDVFALVAMAGFFDAMAITSGGLVSGLTWMVMKKWAFQNMGT